jgi:adenine-specific DNA-methyltransferase
MPELQFKGKEFVFNHHLTVPHRPIVPVPAKSVGTGTVMDNLIIHGDNLHALKALMPMYAGRVDCVFIDPPYNTGNEKWNYNDNVNAPYVKEWLDGNPVNKDDMLRHDKWLCMMYPRLKLLWEVLAETGSFWMTLDDNEIHYARAVLDELFGEHNFIATCIWHKNYSPKNSAQFFSEDHDYLTVYAKDKTLWRPNLLARTPEMEARYANPDNDPRGPWKPGDLSARNYYSEGTYSITCPSGRVIPGPPPGRYWAVSPTKRQQLDADKRLWWGEDGDNIPALKRFLSEVKPGRVPQTIWEYDEVGHTQDAKKELVQILNFNKSEDVFITPKPVALLAKVIEIATNEDSIVLDSFAGSATTAHAVLAANKRDNGNRRFILVECEDYADTLTAERVRRVIQGYAFQGTQRDDLYTEKLNFRSLRNAEKLLERVAAVENLEGHRFDRIRREVKDGSLVVTGEKSIKDTAEGLGGSFTFCTLGAPVDLDKLLTGQQLPDFQSIGSWLFHAATGQAFVPDAIDESNWFLGETHAAFVWLVYKPDLTFLSSTNAVLTLSLAERFVQSKKGKRHLVFAAAKFVPNRLLSAMGIDFAQLPFAVYRVEKD